MAGWLSTATIRSAGGRSGNDMAHRPAPTSSTLPPCANASRAQSWESVSPECPGSKSATGSVQGSSGAWARIRSGIAQAASSCCQRSELSLANRVNEVAAEDEGTLGLKGVGEPVEFLELWIRIVLRVLGHAGNLDDDDVLGDPAPLITAELRSEEARAQELAARVVVTPARQLPLLEEGLVFLRLVRPDVNDDHIDLTHLNLLPAHPPRVIMRPRGRLEGTRCYRCGATGRFTARMVAGSRPAGISPSTVTEIPSRWAWARSGCSITTVSRREPSGPCTRTPTSRGSPMSGRASSGTPTTWATTESSSLVGCS